MTPYQQLSQRGQLARLRPVAQDLTVQFGWGGSALRLLNHGYNTTYGLLRDGKRAALRINMNSIRTREQIMGELAWVKALLEAGSVPVARPLPLADGGGHLALHPFSAIGVRDPKAEHLHAVLYDWLPGRTAGHAWGPEPAHALGRLTRALHDHARSWTVPAEAEMTVPGDVMIDCPLNPKADTPDFREVLARGNRVVERLRRDQPLIPVHFDLHMWNIKWHKGKMSVFDFDDCRMGWPAWDVAITLFYLRRFPEPEACEAAYWQGLGATLDDLGVTYDEMEALIAARGVFLASEMLSEWTAEAVQIGEPYLDVSRKRVSFYLQTGRFDPNVAVLSK